MAKKKQGSKPIKITRSTKLNRFEIGQRVRLELLPLSEYNWDNGTPDVPLDLRDVAILAKSESDEGTVFWAGHDCIEVLSDATGCVHVWARAQLLSVTILCAASASARPSEYSIKCVNGSVSTVFFDGMGLRVLDDRISWNFIRWLAGVMNVGPMVKTDANALDHWQVLFDYGDDGEPIICVGGWRMKMDDAKLFLRWAMDLAPKTETAETTQEN